MMLVREFILEFERGVDPKKQLGIGEYPRIRNLKPRDIIMYYDKGYSLNRRICVIVNVNFDNYNRLYLEYAGFGDDIEAAKRTAKSPNLHQYIIDGDTKTLEEWNEKIINIIKN